MKDIETILCEILDELHYKQYPSENKVPVYPKDSLKDDYFPLHIVKEASKRYHEQF